MADAVIDQVLVDLVADHIDLALADQRGQLVEIGAVDQRAARVVRAVEEDQAGARGNGGGQALPIDTEVRQAQRHMHAAAAGQFHRGLVAVVAGIENDGLIAGADHRLHRTEDRLGCAGSDGHFAVGADLAPVEVGNLGRHLLAQRRQAGHRRVLVVPEHDMPADRLAQCERAVEIGKTLGQVERTAIGGELGHAGEDGGADVRQFAGEHGFDYRLRR
ncbi:hypothetical protein D3C81_1313230 [compost metagenome]